MTPGQAVDWTGRLARARAAVAAELPATPVIESPGLGAGVLLKLESFQPTGSFKVRGALAVLTAGGSGGSPRQASTATGSDGGIVTASSGNHALGVAWAARRLGLPATVVVPVGTSAAKLSGLRRFPAVVIQHGDDYEQADQHARSLAGDRLRYVSATSDPDVIAGQATIGADLLSQVAGTFTVACGIGGGAMASGLGLAGRQSGRMTVVGVEAAASPGMSTAIRAGQVTRVNVRDTLADGLAGNLEPGVITVGLIREHVGRLVSVSEEQIADAIRYLAREHGLVAEGSGAVPVAAVLAGLLPVTSQTVLVISGRNIALETLAAVLRAG
ncbi:MAG TPA: pyridoxal-phosphate dependent enzyme [Streptosporangiaceae bacterium]|nr:pyridoxal-phosphate dependent enzyme [Streptosporangiaceae bacterium]